MKDLMRELNIGDMVKITQPDFLYGVQGVIVDIDIEDDKLPYQVKYAESNGDTPYETWMKEDHVVKVDRLWTDEVKEVAKGD